MYLTTPHGQSTCKSHQHIHVHACVRTTIYNYTCTCILRVIYTYTCIHVHTVVYVYIVHVYRAVTVYYVHTCTYVHVQYMHIVHVHVHIRNLLLTCTTVHVNSMSIETTYELVMTGGLQSGIKHALHNLTRCASYSSNTSAEFLSSFSISTSWG